MPVINKYHHGNRVPPGAVDIMRGSRWGNPFVIGVHGDRGELFRLNCDRLREFVLRRAQGATAPRTTPAVFSLQILQMYETAAQVDKVGCNGTPLQPQGPMTTETQGVEPQETVLVEALQPEQ